MTHCVSVWLTPEGERYTEDVGIEPESVASELAEKRYRWMRGLDDWSPEEETAYQAEFSARNRITTYLLEYPDLTRVGSRWEKPNGDRFLFLTYPSHDSEDHDHDHEHDE